MRLFKIAVFLFLLFLSVGSIKAQGCEGLSVRERIDCYQKELDRLSSQAKTLSNQIAQFDAQIRLTTLKISQTEEKIALLGGRIDQLEVSLTALTAAFSSRAVETYKMARLGGGFWLLVTSPDLTGAVTNFHYLQRIQEADRTLLEKLTTAQTVYKGEKKDQEDLQAELEKQKADLNNQKIAKAALLAVTRNDENRYQQLLAVARAELAVTLGLGKETFLRDVSEGEKIGTIISGSSGCSTGTHLHFEVHQGDTVVNPNNFLKPISFSPSACQHPSPVSCYDYGPDQYSLYGSPQTPQGNWNWPLNEPIQINQEFGHTGYGENVAHYPNGVHTGIDMDSPDKSVKAVKTGKLYGGSYQCGGALAGALLYAKVDQGDGMTVWYLHMIPQ